MKKFLCAIIILIVGVFAMSLIGSEEAPDNTEMPSEPRELKSGEIFEENCYVEVDKVKITYDGENFLIENNSNSIMMVTCGFYGARVDGTYEWIGTPAFSGFDKAQYDKDVQENGWAVKKQTNRVRPGESLTASLTLFDFGNEHSWDVDGDGYYDIKFTLSKQKDESSTIVSTSDAETDYYKLRAE